VGVPVGRRSGSVASKGLSDVLVDCFPILVGEKRISRGGGRWRRFPIGSVHRDRKR